MPAPSRQLPLSLAFATKQIITQKGAKQEKSGTGPCLAEPVLHVAPGLQVLPQRDLLPLGRYHCVDVYRAGFVAEGQPNEVVEALPEVRLHRLRVLRLR